jgi:ketosteroid isomerase-like protein
MLPTYSRGKFMKSISNLVFFVFLLVPLSVFSQTDKMKAILERQKDFAAAILQSDWVKLETFCHEDLIYTHSFGRVDKKSDFLSNISKLKVEQWETESPIVKIYKDTAVVNSNLKVKLTRPNGEVQISQQRAVDVWVRHKKTWLLVSHQSTSYQ